MNWFPSLNIFVGNKELELEIIIPLLTVHRVNTISSKFFIQFSRTDTSSFSGRLSAVVVDVLVGCLIYWSNKDENPFNQNNREQASVEGSVQNVITWSHNPTWKNLKIQFYTKHLKSIELKILWNHILKPVHDVKMAKPGQPCNYFCLLKKVFYFFFLLRNKNLLPLSLKRL